jgi:hypothetical protein
MSQNQRLIVVMMGAASLIVILMLCGTIFYTTLQLNSPATPLVGDLTHTLRVTPISTWTPTPYFDVVVETSDATPTLPLLKEEEDALLDQVELEVVAVRDLLPLQPVTRWKVSRMQLRQRYADLFINEDWTEATHSLVIVYAAFDFMAPNTNLMALWEDDFSDWVAGFYRVDAKDIFVVSDAYMMGAMERAVFAHEYTHALQDQHFDLRSLGLYVTGEPEYSDRLLAAMALVEGDADLVQEMYIERYFSQEDALDMLNQILKRSYVWKDVPSVLGEVSMFPYEKGIEFTRALFKEGGWRMVNQAYTDPPVSTEQILHPERYLASDQPVRVSLPQFKSLDGDWRVVYDDVAGEFLLRLYLGNRLTADEAYVAAEGWGGDHCVVYYNDTTGDISMVLSVVWDTPADAQEFRDAYTRYAEARFGYKAKQTALGVSCWQGLDVVCLTTRGDGSGVVLGPDQETVDELLAAGILD